MNNKTTECFSDDKMVAEPTFLYQVRRRLLPRGIKAAACFSSFELYLFTSTAHGLSHQTAAIMPFPWAPTHPEISQLALHALIVEFRRGSMVCAIPD